MYSESLKSELKRQLHEYLKERSALLDGNKKKSEETKVRIEKLDFKIQYLEDQLKYF